MKNNRIYLDLCISFSARLNKLFLFMNEQQDAVVQLVSTWGEASLWPRSG